MGGGGGGGGRGGDPIRFDPPVRDSIFLRKACRPSAGLRDQEDNTLEGEQSHTGKPDIWAGGGAKPALLPSARREGERAAPPSPPRPHTFGTDEALVNVHSVQTNYPPKLPRKHTQTRTHTAVTPTQRRRGCPPTELNRVRRQGEAEFRNLV